MKKNHKCQSCNSKRIIAVYSHGRDLQNLDAPYLDYEHDGYLPNIPNIGGNDDVEIDVCLECGQVQGTWPVSDECITGIDPDADLHGFTLKQIKKMMDEFWVDTVDGLWESLIDEWGGDTIEEALANKKEQEAEAVAAAAEDEERDKEHQERAAEALKAIRGTNQYYKVKMKHVDTEKAMNPDCLEVVDSVRSDIQDWFGDNNLSCTIEDGDDKGDYGSFVFAVIEDKMNFMKRWG